MQELCEIRFHNSSEFVTPERPVAQVKLSLSWSWDEQTWVMNSGLLIQPVHPKTRGAGITPAPLGIASMSG